MNNLEEFVKNLPIYKYKDLILDSFENNQILIISGDTGCGKTTQVPKYILNYILNYNNNFKGLIGVTQPRRIATISIANRISQELSQENPNRSKDIVSYEIRFENTVTNNTRIKFMTDGILLKEFINDHMLKKYSVIVIDEVHERGLNTDIILGLIKNTIKKRKDLKVIIMSATLEENKLLNFFENSKLIKIEGRFFPIEIYNMKTPTNDYLSSAFDCLMKIHFDEDKGDILVFWTGQEEIEDLYEMINYKIKDFEEYFKNKPIKIYKLYSALPSEMQMKIFENIDNSTRKIILSTNISETSITVKGIKYVIDSGFVKVKLFDIKKNIERLTIIPISKANAIQRAGRSGRIEQGKCYRLYPKDAYNELEEYLFPEIWRVNIINIVLHLKSIYSKIDIQNFNFIDKPELENIRNSITTLKKLGALSDDEEITGLGKNLLEIPLNIFSAFCLYVL